MRISKIDLQCNDIMWFSIDNNGYIVALTSGGEGNVPEYVCRSKEETDKLEKYFMCTAADIGDATLLIDNDGSALSGDAIALSRKGLFCFDVSSEDEYKYGYYKISFPSKPLHINDLPERIRTVLQDHNINVDVNEIDHIMVENAY